MDILLNITKSKKKKNKQKKKNKKNHKQTNKKRWQEKGPQRVVQCSLLIWFMRPGFL